MAEVRLPISEEKATKIATALLQIADWLRHQGHDSRASFCQNAARLLLEAEEIAAEPAALIDVETGEIREPASGAFETGAAR